MSGLALEAVTKHFGPYSAVRDVTLQLRDGEFFVLLGPSGCGKTTTLRIVAGLERQSSGTIRIGDRDVTELGAGKRNISMVFQSYALYPHLSVYRNLVFGPRIRHEPRQDADRRAREIAVMLGIEELLDRRPAQLSGGQRQRVALGRALLRYPDVFLLDEPLSNLDAALRAEVREELVRLHRRLRVTTVYVTHDQVEAMSMGDRIGVMFDGVLVQVGAPWEIFNDPVNLRVATFLGSPPMNTFEASIGPSRDRKSLRLLGGAITLPNSTRLPISDQGDGGCSRSGGVVAGIRPGDIEIVRGARRHRARQ